MFCVLNPGLKSREAFFKKENVFFFSSKVGKPKLQRATQKSSKIMDYLLIVVYVWHKLHHYNI